MNTWKRQNGGEQFMYTQGKWTIKRDPERPATWLVLYDNQVRRRHHNLKEAKAWAEAQEGSKA